MEYNVKNIWSIVSLVVSPIVIVLYMFIVNPLASDITTVTYSPIGCYLSQMQVAMPIWSTVISISLLIAGGFISMGLTTRYSIYHTASVLPLMLFICFTLALGTTQQLLLSVVISMLMLAAMAELFRAAKGVSRTSRIFSSSILFGALPLLIPTAVTLWALYFGALILYYRPKRELIVMLLGLMLPSLTFCYVRWIGGVDFADSIALLLSELTTNNGVNLQIISELTVHNIVLLVTLLAVILLSIYGAIHSDRFSIKSTSRARLILTLITILLCFAMMLIPAFSIEAFALFAVPFAIAIPFATQGFKSRANTAIYTLIIVLLVLRIATF